MTLLFFSSSAEYSEWYIIESGIVAVFWPSFLSDIHQSRIGGGAYASDNACGLRNARPDIVRGAIWSVAVDGSLVDGLAGSDMATYMASPSSIRYRVHGRYEARDTFDHLESGRQCDELQQLTVM